jgi:UDP-N-acetylmuramoylalanine--D-glutamate ligase
LPGRHKAQNAAAAFAVCRALGLPADAISGGIRSFRGLPHRQERVADIDGVAYVNDSKATNAAAAARALSSYPSVYWIAGGRPKEGGLNGIEPYLSSVRHAFLIGEAEQLFAEQLADKVEFTRCGTLAVALSAAHAAARKDGLSGAVVLLSPACASFDQFKNFEARGDAFRALVERLG